MPSAKHATTALFLFCTLGVISYIHPHHIHPLRTYYHEILIFLGLIGAFFYIAKSQAWRLYFPSLLLLPVGLFFLVILQIAAGIIGDVFDVALPLIYFLFFALALIVGASLAATPDGAGRLCNGLALMHLLAALLSLVMQQIQMSGINAMPFVMYIASEGQAFMRPYANVAQPNQLALLFCLALASLWYLYQSFRLTAMVSVLLSLMLLWGIALTQSRIAWMILPVFVVLCGMRPVGERAVDRRFLLIMLLLYIALVLWMPQIGQMLGFSSGSVIERSGGRSERLVLWQQAWQMALSHPWLGVGWFGFGAEQVRIAADFSPTTYAEHSHNLLLNFAAELGLPVTILIFSMLTWWFWQTCLRVMRIKPALPVRFATLFLLAVFLHSLVEFPLWYAFVSIPCALLMGMLHQQRWPATPLRLPRIAVILVTGTCSLLLLAVTLDYQRVVAGFATLRLEQGATLIGKATLQAPAISLFPQFFSYFEVMQMTPHEGMSAADIAKLERMSQRFGFVHILNKLAEVYVLNGQVNKAGRMMLTLQRLHPDAYPAYFDYWKAQSVLNSRYRTVFEQMPKRDSAAR
jgi:O-antigen ligase